MTYTIAEPCIGVCDKACVEECPVDCIQPRDGYEDIEGKKLYIDPDTCIDCGLCIDECPVQAIFPEEDLPVEWQAYLAGNAEWYQTQS